MDFRYRKTTIDDLNDVMEAIEDSRAVLKLQNTGQWQDGFPNKDMVIKDIENGQSYVFLDNQDQIIGTCAITDFDQNYVHLFEGKWLSDYPYMVLHRVAIKKDYKGNGFGHLFFKLFELVARENNRRSLKVDTHEGNFIMRHLLEKEGFVYCGKTLLIENNKPRVVYEKVLEKYEGLTLVFPCEKYIKSYREAYEEHMKLSPNSELIFSNREDYLNRVKDFALGKNLPEGYVAATNLWLIENNEVVGEIGIRHKLTDRLLGFGGNIGYEIRPSKRGQGYGTKMLSLALDYAKENLGLKKALITCDSDNYASEKVMINNGGILGEMIPYKSETNEGTLKKYWINLDKHIIETDRFYLREITNDDFVSLKEIYGDSETMKYFIAPYDDRKVHRLIDWTLSNYAKYGFGFWAIIDKDSGEFIGDCGLSMQNIDGEMLPEIGYHINKKFHNKGYASQAARAVKEYIFKFYAYDYLYSYMNKENIASIKVAKNNDMELYKEYRDDDEDLVVYRVKRNS